MVVNFKACGINKDACKLTRTSMLIIIKKNVRLRIESTTLIENHRGETSMCMIDLKN
jgi:hypothetical protein